MRVALVAGDEAGHAFPAFALAQQFTDAGHDATVYTGVRWSDVELGRASIAELAGLAAAVGDDDSDAGAKLSTRAARMAVRLAPDLRGSYDVVISDVITRAGAWAADLVGLPWIELSPHPLYEQSCGLPPIGMGLAAGHGMLAKALGAGVPVVMLPGGGDQPELAARVSRLGAGLTVRTPDPDVIAAAVRRVLGEPDFRAAARAVAASGAAIVDPVAVVERAVADGLS